MTEENGTVSQFKKAMQGNPPRLVVSFKRDEDGNDQFQWGIVGNIPILTLIGGVVGMQRMLLNNRGIPECDESALVMMFDSGMVFCHEDMPGTPLVGMLEIIKTTLVNNMLANKTQQSHILGPDGSPITNRIKGL